MKFYEMETERLLLKNIAEDDREFILKEFSDDDVNRYLYDEEPFTTLEEADDLIDFYVNGEPKLQHRWILVLKNTGEKIGTCGFHCWNQQEQSVEVGYDLQKKYWGFGYMSEALKSIFKFAAEEMKVHEIHAHISAENQNSMRIAERFGFSFTGKTFECTFRGKEYLHKVYSYKVPSKR